MGKRQVVKTAGMPGDHQFDLKIHYKTVSKVLKQDLTPYQFDPLVHSIYLLGGLR